MNDIAAWFRRIVRSIDSAEKDSALADAYIESSGQDMLGVEMESYWDRRLSLLPQNYICPVCRLVKPNSRQWHGESGLCRSCWSTLSDDDEVVRIPDFKVIPYGRKRVWIYDLNKSAPDYAKIFRTDRVSTWRWMCKWELPVGYTHLEHPSRIRELIVESYTCIGLPNVIKAMGISDRAMDDIVGGVTWRNERLSKKSWHRFIGFIVATAGRNKILLFDRDETIMHPGRNEPVTTTPCPPVDDK